ncbi:eukaryotic aspartyl protease [Colletotrichum orchidophilum]|uniref:Eukaryotic aspartyl protease n=1 Tax=Colletotrichum orchidophilum TaxID=1209926 RepID=A0A1G4APT4_9PEZI|nr:eukaryotic aspartyl protease [Colletotrichum orchidophilum]OHE91177.1 eukaryotic aspartyl protease [Colletotrichum orchidophilum]
MKLSTTFALAALASEAVSQKVVSASFHKIQLPLDLVQITRRDNTLTLAALNNITGGGYYSEVEIGTPGQKALLHVDTGSSDTWIVDKQADLCTSPKLQRLYETGCTETFNSTASSTYKVVGRNSFDITYLDGKNIRGDYIQDAVSIHGKTVTDQQLGLAFQTVKGTGLIGLGFSQTVAAKRKYPTILDNMVTQGVIGRKAFSIWLNDLSSSEGTLLFGGIDTEKYIGSLTTLPLVNDYHSGNMTSYSVALTGVDIETPDGKTVEMAEDNFNASTVLDSGSTVCLLPEQMAKSIWVKYDVVDAGYGFIDCKWGGAEGQGHFFDFQFAGVKIRVPMEEMVLDNLGPIMDQLKGLTPFEKPCMFGIQNSATFDVNSTEFALLGDTFLRSAYVVYDEANRQVGIAQSNLNASRSNVVELRVGETALPTATGVASQASTPAPTPTPTRAGTGTGTGTGTETGTAAAGKATSIVSAGLATPSSSESPNAASHPGAVASETDGFFVMTLMSVFAVVGAALMAG